MPEIPQATRADRAAAKIGYLSETDVFRDLTAPELAELDRTTIMQTCERGRVFYLPGQTGEVLFILKKGRVQLYRLSAEGRKLVFATLDAGTVFGEMSLIGQGMYDSFAEAIESCTICVMSRRDVERLLQEKPHLGIRLLELVARRLQEVEVQLEDVAFRSVPARLAALLVRLAADGAGDVPQGAVIDGLTHQDLADMLGVYRETVTTTLAELRGTGIISVARRRQVIHDPQRLRDVADPGH